MSEDSDFDRFCLDLETLKGHTSHYITRAGLTQKIMHAIYRDKKARLHLRFSESIAPVAVIGVLFIIWFFFHTPPGRA